MLARAQHVPNIAASERMVLHTCCDLDLAECRDVHGALHTSKDMHATIADPDVEAIVLATHETIRREPIEAAAKAGKPIYVEKPMAHSIDEAYAIADVVHESGIPYCVGHNRVEDFLERLTDEYKRHYYTGLYHERKAKATLAKRMAGTTAYQLFRDLFRCYIIPLDDRISQILVLCHISSFRF